MTETETSTQETGSSNEPNPTPLAALLRHWKIGLLAVCLLAIGVYIFGTKFGKAESRAAVQGATASVPAVSVATVAAKTGSIPVYLTGLGAVTPINTVTVKTQVNGQLISVRYQEGQLVRVGDLLAEIDPRPLQAQLTQFEGQLVRDQALLDNARLDLKRFTVLVQENSIPRQQYDTQVSLVRQLEGTVKNDQGLIEGVKVQLIYTRITAPVSGRVGLRLVDPGNFVQTTDTNGLVVITQLQPITVIFTIPEDSIPSVVDKLKRGARLPVEAYDRALQHRLATGYLLTIDNQVDPTTGTVKLRAVFPNDSSVATYRQTVLTAFQGVEDNLAALRILEQEAGVQDGAVKAAGRSVFLTINQYQAGTVSYLNVVTAQTIALTNELTAIQILGQRMTAAVLLVQALGGGWNVSQLPQLP